jgi:DNA-binding MarR family transcriptional regulator
VEFGYLRESLELTAGNLSRHITVLAEAGLVEVDKGYEGRRPRTWVRITPPGRTALAAEMAALGALVRQHESSHSAGGPQAWIAAATRKHARDRIGAGHSRRTADAGPSADEQDFARIEHGSRQQSQRGGVARADDSEVAAVQGGDLGDYGRRHQQRAPRQVKAGEELDTGVVVVVVREGGRHKWASVTDDHADRPKPSFSSSSLFAAVSVRAPVAAPNQAGGHGRPVGAATRSRSSATAADTSASGSSSTSRCSSSRSALTPPC